MMRLFNPGPDGCHLSLSLDTSETGTGANRSSTLVGSTIALNSNINPPKTVSESSVTMSRQMMPSDANPWGYVHGGMIMKMVDEAAGSAAIKHTRMRVSTAAIDYMSFLHPVSVGDLVTIKAAVNDVGHTSMEVGVRVEAENMLTGEVKYTSSCYLVMVALDDEGRPCPVPAVVAQTAEQKRRMAAAKIRRTRRRQLQAELRSTD